MAVACLDRPCSAALVPTVPCFVVYRSKVPPHASRRARAPADAAHFRARPSQELTIDLGSPVEPTASRHWNADRLQDRRSFRAQHSFRAHSEHQRRLADAEHFRAKPSAGSLASECCYLESEPGSANCQPGPVRLSFLTPVPGSGPGLHSGSSLMRLLDCGQDPDSGRSPGFDPDSGCHACSGCRLHSGCDPDSGCG